MSTWLRATGESPVAPSSPDEAVVIGPFERDTALGLFLLRHGRVFSGAVTVYTPDEYDAEVAARDLENAADTADGHG